MAKTAKNTKFWAFALAPRAEKLPNTDAADELPGEDTTTPAPELAGDEGVDQIIGKLTLHGEIAASSWWGDEITSKQFSDDLDGLGVVNRIDCSLNSLGGDVFAAAAIYSLLKRNAAEVHMYIDGVAASAATIIAMAGDKVFMPANAMMMVHNPYTFASGNADELRKVAKDLDTIRDAMTAAYAAKTGKTPDELKTLLDAETWMTADDCINNGFADEILDATIPVEIDEAEASGNIWVVNGTKFDFSAMTVRPAAMIGKVLRAAEDPLDADPTPSPSPARGGEQLPARAAFTAVAATVRASIAQEMNEQAMRSQWWQIQDGFREAYFELLPDDAPIAVDAPEILQELLAEYSALMQEWMAAWIALDSKEILTAEARASLRQMPQVQAQAPDIAPALAAARLEGIKAERARQAELDEMIIPGTSEVAALSQRMVTEARKDGTDIGVIAIALQKAQRDPLRRAQMLADRAEDGGDGVKPIAAMTGDGIDPKMPTQNAFEAALTKAVSGVK